MGSRALCVMVLMVAGCLEVPTPGQVPSGTDAGSFEDWLDAGGVRPATGRPYRGPSPGASPGVAPEGAHAPRAPSQAGDGGVLADADEANTAQDGDAAAAARPAARRPGDLLISELMANPVVIDDSAGEWVELHNPTAAALSLDGCSLDDGGRTPRALDPALSVAGGGYLTLARSLNAGFTPDAVLALSLSNQSDGVAVICAGIEIDRFSYGSVHKVTEGASLSRDADGIWCDGTLPYGDNLGTPGQENPSCTAPDPDADAGAR